MYYHPVVHFLSVSSVSGDEPLPPGLLRHGEHHHHQLRPQQGPWQPTSTTISRYVAFIHYLTKSLLCLLINPSSATIQSPGKSTWPKSFTLYHPCTSNSCSLPIDVFTKCPVVVFSERLQLPLFPHLPHSELAFLWAFPGQFSLNTSLVDHRSVRIVLRIIVTLEEYKIFFLCQKFSWSCLAHPWSPCDPYQPPFTTFDLINWPQLVMEVIKTNLGVPADLCMIALSPDLWSWDRWNWRGGRLLSSWVWVALSKSSASLWQSVQKQTCSRCQVGISPKKHDAPGKVFSTLCGLMTPHYIITQCHFFIMSIMNGRTLLGFTDFSLGHHGLRWRDVHACMVHDLQQTSTKCLQTTCNFCLSFSSLQ